MKLLFSLLILFISFQLSWAEDYYNNHELLDDEELLHRLSDEDKEELGFLRELLKYGPKAFYKDNEKHDVDYENLYALKPEFFVYTIQGIPSLGANRILRLRGEIRLDFHFRRYKALEKPDDDESRDQMSFGEDNYE